MSKHAAHVVPKQDGNINVDQHVEIAKGAEGIAAPVEPLDRELLEADPDVRTRARDLAELENGLVFRGRLRHKILQVVKHSEIAKPKPLVVLEPFLRGSVELDPEEQTLLDALCIRDRREGGLADNLDEVSLGIAASCVDEGLGKGELLVQRPSKQLNVLTSTNAILVG